MLCLVVVYNTNKFLRVVFIQDTSSGFLRAHLENLFHDLIPPVPVNAVPVRRRKGSRIPPKSPCARQRSQEVARAYAGDFPAHQATAGIDEHLKIVAARSP